MRYIFLENLENEINSANGSIYPALISGRVNKLSGNFQTLLTPNLALKKHHIEKIRSMGVRHICIQDPLTDDIEIEEPIDETLILDFEYYIMKLQSQLYPIFYEYNRKFLDQKIFNTRYRIAVHAHMCKSSIASKLTKTLKGIYEEFFFQYRVKPLYNFAVPINSQNYLVYQATLSALLGAKIQIWLGASQENTWNLFVGTALQDIGVSPKYFTAVETTPQDEKIFKVHPKLGLMIVNETPLWNALMGIVSLNHHRYINRSGFPGSLRIKRLYDYEKGMHTNGKIGSAVNAYAALCCFYPAHKVLNSISSTFKDFLFEAEFTKSLNELIDPYPTGSALELISGERGIVKRENGNPHFDFRIIYDHNRKRLSKKKDIRLTAGSKRIKGPWYVDEILKARVIQHYPEIMISYLEASS